MKKLTDDCRKFINVDSPKMSPVTEETRRGAIDYGIEGVRGMNEDSNSKKKSFWNGILEIIYDGTKHYYESNQMQGWWE